MDKFSNLYNFIDLAKANRKYLESTANNLKSALKIFEKELTNEEINSITIIEERIEEIFKELVNSNKEKSILSLNTYKARLKKVIKDYKRYGTVPEKMKNWTPKEKKSLPTDRHTRLSTPLLIRKDKKDKDISFLSNSFHTPVEKCHRIEFILENGSKANLLIPCDINKKDLNTIKALLDSLTK